MPRRTPSSASNPFFQERSVVAQEDGADGSWCPCILSLTFDKADDDGNDPDKTGAPRQGIVTLQPQCQYPFKGHESRIPVSLRVPLENLKSVSRRFTTVGDMSPAITHHLSRKHSIRRRAQVLTLTLTISSPGSVIVPLTVSKLTPKTEDQKPIQAFQRLCRSTKIMIHTYVPEGTEIPEAMLDSIGRLAGQKGMLMSLPAGLASLYNGRGARETTWEVFDLPDELPPAYTPRPGQTKNSPDSPPKKRPTGYSKAIIPDPAGCISKTNSPTNLSAPAVSPLPTFPDASSKPKARPDESAKSPAPIAAAEGSFPSVVRDAVQNAVREMLPALLEATLLEMLPNVILPVVREQFPDVAEQYLEDEDIVGEAQFAVSEEKEDALIEIHEEKNKVLKEVLEEISEKRENAVNEVDEGVESGYMRLLQTEETARLSIHTPYSIKASMDYGL
ncbi:hypothetical protein B0J12DRAFT_746050 [Macrophomina phaseolina]|uniref:Uncharacterized protein n=1 Tax=Macrophomina phaseolina TaxID=35725 RepID=A0ABQ8FTU6_9PEZI|nr:hypothetical protein B0J12DRAFT_746050 [Macrophomina phaseolina]